MTDQYQSSGGSELRGKIKWFNPEKGFGFVTPADGSSDVFLHISALKDAGLQDAPEGSTITCEVGQGRKGIQVLRVINLDTSTAAPARPAAPRRPFGGGGNGGGARRDFGGGDRGGYGGGDRGGYGGGGDRGGGDRGGGYGRGPRQHHDD
ncbi:cold-shock protein [Dongia mobilis]|jgi:CspA family cold shock protein|uniref:cold-shock protein n=1 Tax=Dongia sp. TaxID=1977262 RepID=UPI0026E9DD25